MAVLQESPWYQEILNKGRVEGRVEGKVEELHSSTQLILNK